MSVKKEIQDLFSSEEFRDYFARFGRQGGKVRAQKMTAEERKESARKAARARWNRPKKKG
jgi:hypothetical protein